MINFQFLAVTEDEAIALFVNIQKAGDSLKAELTKAIARVKDVMGSIG